MPLHRVQISPFCIGKAEVTAAAYQAWCVDKGESRERALDHVSWPGISDTAKKKLLRLRNAGKPDKGDHPINCVAWPMAENYCKQKGPHLPTGGRVGVRRARLQPEEVPVGRRSAERQVLLNACGKECAEWKRSQKDPEQTMFDESERLPRHSARRPRSRRAPSRTASSIWRAMSGSGRPTWYAPYTETDAITVPPVDPEGPPTGDKRAARR